ncbi:MAG: right-handed parallel beta-helix repeat-containing protein [Luteolibacter sp.]
MKLTAFLSLLLACSISASAAERLRDSPGSTTYHIDPAAGDDSRSGLARDQAWRTFRHLDQLRLAPGDRVEIVAPGELTRTLSLSGAGTAERPIEVRFAPGRYDVRPDELHREAWQISNTNSDPDTPKAVALHLDAAAHVRISGPGARLVSRGKMIHVCIENSAHIAIDGLAVDYHRPTVSEFKVREADADSAVLEIHRDSAYSVTDGKLVWQGEGWTETGGLGQQLDPASGRVHRMVDPLKGLAFEKLRPLVVRATGRHQLKAGRIYQLRNPFRDCAGVFTRRSRDVTWKDVRFHFLHGMGVVSQFSENLTFDTVSVAPDPASGRTTAAWADCFHFSGCRGRIVVKDCVFSGAHDDAINIHGTYLRIVEKLSDKQIKVRFMHPQTFGFLAFNPGDEVAFLHSDTMASYSANRVTAATLASPKELVLTLDQPIPGELRENDVLENLTWNPEVEIRGCKVSLIPTRGFLLSSSRSMIVEDNEFIATHNSGINVDPDARNWYESGAVHDLTIRRNRFVRCGDPAITIHSRNPAPNPALHRNIRILENEFILRGDTAVSASGTTGLRVSGNIIRAAATLDDDRAIRTRDCADVTIGGNQYPVLAE